MRSLFIFPSVILITITLLGCGAKKQVVEINRKLAITNTNLIEMNDSLKAVCNKIVQQQVTIDSLLLVAKGLPTAFPNNTPTENTPHDYNDYNSYEDFYKLVEKNPSKRVIGSLWGEYKWHIKGKFDSFLGGNRWGFRLRVTDEAGIYVPIDEIVIAKCNMRIPNRKTSGDKTVFNFVTVPISSNVALPDCEFTFIVRVKDKVHTVTTNTKDWNN